MKTFLRRLRLLVGSILILVGVGTAHAQYQVLQNASGTLSTDIGIGASNNVSNSGTIWNNGAITGSGSFTTTGATSLASTSATVLTLSGAFKGTTASVSTLTVGNGILGTSATAGIGYGAGSGGTVVQATNKSTAVTLNNVTGQITLNIASLSSATNVSFTLTNSAISSYDTPIVAVASGGTLGAYNVWISSVGTGSASVTVRNNNASTLSESPVISFGLIKGSSN
jgi:hypothetical protein